MVCHLFNAYFGVLQQKQGEYTSWNLSYDIQITKDLSNMVLLVCGDRLTCRGVCNTNYQRRIELTKLS